MELVQSDAYKKINKDEGWEDIVCPICGAEWFARGEYWNCEHLVFTACTYFGFDFNYIRDDYKEGPVVQEVLKVANNYQMHLQLDNNDTSQSFDDMLLEKLSATQSTDVSHVLVDHYVSTSPDAPAFITVFGYQTVAK